MPIYEYVCPECGHKFELLRRAGQAEEAAPCPRCNTPARHKFSAFASFSQSASGQSAAIAGGGGGSCAGCSASSCGTCAG
ncbi:MAG: zinc ribbon domain-containing protein [Chloroflexi bacterium]|nr:zinc ribbon domain-containing protein [Chloroflexota bacterium]